MPNVYLNSDRTTANYEQTINYTLNASFNSLTEAPGSNIEIICFIPDTLTYVYHSPTYPIQSITPVPATNGTNLVFSLLPLPDAGISIYFDLYINFKLSTPNQTQATVLVTVTQNGTTIGSYSAPTVTLNAVPNYIATQTNVLPTSTGGVSGDIFIADIIIENIGDPGAPITSFNFTEVLPTPLTLDNGYTITGLDISDNVFADPNADGLTATVIDNNSFSFYIPSYRGTKYRIRFKGQIASGLAIGNQYVATGTYNYTNITPVSLRTCNNVFQILSPAPNGSINLYTPNYTSNSALINVAASISNTGNTALHDVFFHINNISSGTIPYIQFNSFKTGTMSITALNQIVSIPYTISFITVKGATIPPLSANTDTSRTITASDITLPPDDNLITLIYTFLEPIPTGATFNQPTSFNGIVNGSTPDASYSYINSTLEWSSSAGTSQVDQNNTISIDNISELAMTAIEVAPNNSVKPGDTITYEASIVCTYSPLKEPVLVMILDSRLSYDNFISYSYTDFFGVATNIPEPTPMIIPYYGGGPNTVFMISYSGADSYTFSQLATITITMRFKVNADATGTISQQILLGTYTGEFAIAPIYDTYNAIQSDGSVRALLATSSFINQIEVSMGLTSDFMVKGSLDTHFVEYPEVGNTLAGSPINYQLLLTNKGDTNITYIEIVNILPHINDTGVILTNTSRGSEFNIYPLNFGEVSVSPTVAGIAIPTFTIYYSQSYDPVRFGGNMNTTIGTVNDWSTTLPEDTTTIKAYKLVSNNGSISPGQTLTLLTLATSPSDAPKNLEAWDSFAASITYIDEDGNATSMLPVEPEMVGVKINAPSPNTVTLGGFVWEDLAKTGIYETGDPGINDVAVLLYNSQGQLVQTVFTAPNESNQPGYYKFSNLPHDKYILRFAPNVAIYSLTTQVLDNPNGSLPSPETGFTPVLDMTTALENLHIIAGLINISDINNILKINQSANKMLRSVLHNQMLLNMKLEDVKQLI